MEPDWGDVERRLMGMTVRQLRQIGRAWFNGSLGGASAKRDVVWEMVSQMRSWWRLPDGLGRQRVRNVIEEMD